MGYASKSTVSGHRTKVVSCPSVRSHLTRGVALAGAGILAVSLVIAPPELDDATKPQVRTVQLASFALPSAATLGALLQKIIVTSQAQADVPVAGAAAGAAAEVTAADVKTALAVDSALNPQGAGAATLAAAAAPLGLGLGILSPLLANPLIASIVGPILLFGPLIVLVVLACPPCALFNVLSYIPSFFGIYLPVPALALASTAMVEEIATDAPTLKSDSLVIDSAPAITATAKSVDAVDAAPAAETVEDVSPAVISAEPEIETAVANNNSMLVTDADEVKEDSTTDVTEAAEVEQNSKKDVTEADEVEEDSKKGITESAEADDDSTGVTAADASESTDSSEGDSSDSGDADGS